MHISENPDTQTKLLYSLEVEHNRKQISAVGILVLIFGSIMFLREPVIGVLFTLVMLPFLIYYGCRLIRIFRRADRYVFCRVTLSEPHHNFWHKSYSFTVTLGHPEIGHRTRQTQPIFLPYGAFEPLLVNYMNQTVTVAYNPLTDTLVVIG